MTKARGAVQARESASDGKNGGEPTEAPQAEVEPVSGPEVLPAVVEPGDDQAAFRVMDRHDEDLILRELQGRAIDTMLYSFESGGRKVTDLSYAGVLEAVRTLNARGFTSVKVTDAPPVVDDFLRDDERWTRVMVYAEDSRNGGGAWGVAEQPHAMKLRGGKTKQDEYFFQKALSKAQRNALRSFIPVEMRATLVAQYLGDETKVKKIQAGAGAEKLAELPPPLTDDRADQLRSDIEWAFKQLREHNPVKLPPARYNEYVARSEWSHDRLLDLRSHVADLLKDEGTEIKQWPSEKKAKS